METIIHEYSYYINEPEGAKAYQELCAFMAARGTKCFETWGGSGSHHNPEIDGKTLTIETEHLFANQWNTAPVEGFSESGLRVFDWAQDFEPYGNKRLKRGHWLDLTPEMREIRESTLICGYCGKNWPKGTAPGVFCDACLDSPYLKESELFLLRLMPVALNMPERARLTAEESAALLPAYIDRQTKGADSRAVQETIRIRERVERKWSRTLDEANEEHAGMVWLLDRGLSIDNCIYYSHTKKFSFGWRSPVSQSIRSKLLDVLTEFPFAYEIKCDRGNVQTRDGAA